MGSVLLSLPLAYGLDLALGDPRWLPHPVRGLGVVIERAERFLRAHVRNEHWAGRFLVFGITLGTFGMAEGILWAAREISWGLSLGLEAALLYVCLSTRDLAVESWPVYEALRLGDLAQARKKVAMIVGRDTDRLTQAEVVRATAETIGESLMDGIVAPLFYAVLGGAPLACLYKAVNTLDSMVGYRSARYLAFGQAAARLDSWMNFIPARITSVLIAAAAQVTGFSGSGSLRAFFWNSEVCQENPWIPEAAMAGALEVQLGGVNFYQGKAVETPPLGDSRRPLTPDLIPQAVRILYACSLIGFIVAWGTLHLGTLLR